MFSPERKCVLLLSVFFLFLITAQKTVSQVEWRPVSQEELQMKTPKVEPDADAEAIFWEIKLDDKKFSKMTYSHYVRVKIFTERGREKFSKFDIPFTKGRKIEKVAARVIKADGSIVELQPGDIFERDIITARKTKIKAKSFAVPGIEPGVIVEYQYEEAIKGDSASGERLVFQRDIPMQRVTYYVRPYKGSTLNFVPFNMPDVSFRESNDRFFVGTMTNVKSVKEEPYMPPDDEVRSWTFLNYAPLNIGNQTLGAMVGWSFFANNYSGLYELMTKSNKNIKKQAAEITNGATTEEDKLKKIYAYVQSQIKNISYDKSLTDEQREDIDIDKIEDVIKERAGTAYHINLLFGALANAAGFETNLYYSSNRSEIFFNPDKISYGSFLHNAGIAVRVNNQWMYFDPGTPYLAFGDMFWHDQNTVGMLISKERHSWIKTPLVNYEKSQAHRAGKLKISEDGALEGSIKVEYTGNRAISRREDGFKDSQSKREEDYKEELKGQMSAAEITNLSIENFEDSSKPLTYSYKIRIPNYAQKTGKRIFFQPGLFEYGSTPTFSSATRTYDIFFPYPWSENDEIEIEMPKNYELDNAETPGLVADPGKIGSLDIKMGIDKASNTLIYRRKFYFGGSNNILFPASVYQPLKTLFDAFHKADTHTISIKQKAG